MKLNNDNSAAAKAHYSLERWLDTLRGNGGYYGPVVGMRGTSLTWCGAAHDWRWEGLLNGWVSEHRKTDNPDFLERIDMALRDLIAAQLADGSFRNSCFEQNPHEGGMPHEPAVITSVLRACKYLNETGRKWPDGTEAMLKIFVEERLIKTLWNKTLQTFNNWMQSDFEIYSPSAVASIIETLFEYGDITDTGTQWIQYINGAAESLLKIQYKNGPLTGALPVNNTDRTSASPWLSARCLPALMLLHDRTGDNRFADASGLLADFVTRKFREDGGLVYMAFTGRPDRITPLFTGAAAGALTTLKNTDKLDNALLNTQLDWLLSQQTESGGFNTAAGFGTGLPQRNPPDWRDLLPACGWAPMIYELLTGLNTEFSLSGQKDAETVIRSVSVCGHPAEMTEDSDTISIRERAKPLFIWHKRTVWPEVCLL